jgi:hypothetical protein
MQTAKPPFFRIALDMLVIGALLAVVNWLTSKPDPGWQLLNPTPWLLLPLMIGAKYGLWAGTFCGAITSVAVMLTQQRLAGAGVALQTVAQASPFYYSALVLGGLIAGAFRRVTKTRVNELETQLHQSTSGTELLRLELDVVREGRSQLQCQLLLHGNRLTTLDDDLRKLLASPESELASGLLGVIHRQSGLISAALYEHQGAGKLQQVATLHPTPELPSLLHTDEVPLAAKALAEQTLASIPAPVSGTAEQPYLAAIPWMWRGKDGVLLIQNMPLRSFDWEHLSQIELAMNWAFSLDTLRQQRRSAGDPSAFVALEDFLFLLNESLQAEQTHQLPSVICRADFVDPKQSADASLVRRILNSLPATAVPTRLPSTGSIIALLPFGGEMEGAAVGREMAAQGAKLRTSSYSVLRPVDGPCEVTDFWALVTKD